MKVLELFSGIGGMHFALNESGLDGTVIAAIDINPSANLVYKHNFPDTKLLNKNIEGISAAFVNNLNVDTILMSPPCQPFTCNGKQLDVEDLRTKSFLHLLDILKELHNIQYVLIENVEAFKGSIMNEKLLETLNSCNFVYSEFVLNPIDFGIPNSRKRYYCLAKKQPLALNSNVLQFQSSDNIYDIGRIIESDLNDTQKYQLTDEVIKKYANTLDICYPASKRSCCFTKSYGRYVQGTGSVYCDKTEDDVHMAFNMKDKDEQLLSIKLLKLRFFTPKEISRLMSFPDYFQFPSNMTDKQKYMLLGNSINVKVVSQLIKLLHNY